MPRWPGVVGWSVGALTGVSAVVGLAHLHGSPPDASGGFPDPVLATLAKPGVAVVAAFGALMAIAYCIRHLRLEFLAWWPGRIVVHDFVPDPALTEADVERLTVRFRDRLAKSHLQSPAPSPAPAEQGDFLDVLARNGVDSGNPLGSLLSVLRAAAPTHAYEVRGAFVRRDARPSCGVTVQVARLPGKRGAGYTVWDTSWDGATRQAADYATASILPRTRVCRSPWAGWRRYYMPATLFQAYERAAELEQARRYDEALDSYYRAVREDPMNLGLRLQIGFLQEKLGLYLDAFDTYHAILQVAEPTGERRHRLKRDAISRAYRRSARRDRDRSILVARYRRAVLLGGDGLHGLPHQWCKRSDPQARTERDEQRDRLRERLTPALEGLFEKGHAFSERSQLVRRAYRRAGRSAPRPRDYSILLGKPRSPQVEGSGCEFEELFLLASLHQLEDLRRQIALRPLWRHPSLSKAAVKISSLLVSERLHSTLGQPRCKPGRGWRPYIEEIGKDLKRIEGWARFNRWQEHYNAACVYALPLLAASTAEDGHDIKKLTNLAIERLEQATATADSAFIASRRDWLTSEDPDLHGLRARPEFRRFEAAYFPSASRTPQRPPNVHKWEVSRYTLDLLRETARRWEETWDRRAHGSGPDGDIRLLLDWCNDEARAWQLATEVARHHRHWRTRFKLLDEMHRWSADYDFEPIEVPFPRFSGNDEAGLEAPNLEKGTREAIEDKDIRLERFLELLKQAKDPHGGGACRLLDELEAWRVALRRLDTDGRQLRSAHIARLCGAHAEVWRRMRELLTPAGDLSEGGEELRRALVDTAEAWRNIQGRRRAGDLIRSRVRVNGAGPTAREPVQAAGSRNNRA